MGTLSLWDPVIKINGSVNYCTAWALKRMRALPALWNPASGI